MKKFLFVCAIAAFAACNNSGSDTKAADTTAKMSADTTAKMSADTTAKMAADTTKKDTMTKK
ncbi:MAG TPA: hypothetical protein VMH27_02035 [Puia sp.]|nr:hypothetical protein [Puia sp.]